MSTTPSEPAKGNNRQHLEALLDAALADTFPASDPISNLVADEPPETSEPEQDAEQPS